MNPSAKSFMYAYSALLLLNSSFAMPGQEEAQQPPAPQAISKQTPQEHQPGIFPIEALPDTMVFEILNHLSARDQLSFTQTNKKLRKFLGNITNFIARKTLLNQGLSSEFYDWLKNLKGLSSLVLDSIQRPGFSELLDFSGLNAFLKDSKLTLFSFKTNYLGSYTQTTPQQAHGLLASLPNTLQELDLSRNLIWGDPSFIKGMLEKLALKPMLRVLKFSGNHDLGDNLWQKEGVFETLAQTRVKVLHLENTAFGKTSLQTFLQRSHETHLTDLYVTREWGYRISDEAFRAYTQNPPQIMNLDGKPFTVHFGE